MPDIPHRSQQASAAPASHAVDRRTRWPMLATVLLLAGLLERLWFLLRMSRIAGDAVVYGALARDLLLHGTYGLMRGNGQVLPSLFRLPGYPLFLAASFRIFGVDRYTPVLLLQIVADLGTCILCGLLARRWFGPRAGLAALALGSLCPFMANYTVAPLTETLVLFTIALSFYALDRWSERLTAAPGRPWFNPWLLVVGIACAYSLLLRPDQGLLAAALVPAIWWLAARSSVRSLLTWPALAPVLVVSALTLLPLVPWTARNWHDFHIIQPLAPRSANDPGESSPSGFQRWYRTWAIDFASTEQVYWHYDGEAILIADLPNRAFDTQAEYEATDALFDAYNQDNVSTPAIDARFSALAAQRVAADPLRFYIALPLARVANMLFRPRADMLPVPLEWWRWRAHPSMTLFALCWAGLNLVYFGCAAATLARPGRWVAHAPLVMAMVAFFLLRCALLATLDNSESRYTLEFFPLLIVLGAAAFMRPSKEI